ncbi:MAG: M24 family metallopeptidase [Dehalococcoidia bacterium]
MIEEPSIVLRVTPEFSALSVPQVYVPPFGPAEYEGRLDRIRTEMESLNLDAVIISDPKSVWWLAAGKAKFEYADNPIWLIVPREDHGPVTAVVRHLERETFERSASNVVEEIAEYRDGGIVMPYDPVPVVADVLRGFNVPGLGLGVAYRYFNVQDYARLKELLPSAKHSNFPAEQVRAIKSAEELNVMSIAARVNAQALYKAIGELRIGSTEWDFMERIRQLHSELLGPDYGGTSESAQTAQFGSHAHDMHPKRLAAEMQTMTAATNAAGNLEPGVFVKSYVGCMMRPVFFGDSAPDVVVRAIEASAEGLEDALAMMRPGVRFSDVDRVIREPMLKTGLEVRSRTGYGCGIEWDEGNAVSLAPGTEGVLQEGHTLHVIAHTYGPYGFLGLSEQVTITNNGCRVLADEDAGCPRQLFLVT